MVYLFTSQTWPIEIPYGVLKSSYWLIGPNEHRLDALRALIGCCRRQSVEWPRLRCLTKHGTGFYRLVPFISPILCQGHIRGVSKSTFRIGLHKVLYGVITKGYSLSHL